MHHAIENERWEALKLVEQFGGDILHHDKQGQSPLSKVIKKGRVDIAQRYLDEGADIHFKEPDQTPPLMSYLRDRDFEAFEFMLQNKVDPNEPDASGSTPLQLALGLGLPDRAVQLIDAGATAEKMQIDGNPVLVSLTLNPAKYNVLEWEVDPLVTGLVLAGAELEAVDSETLQRPIHIAIERGDQAMFDVLMDHEVSVDDCLWKTIHFKRPTMLRRLARAGVNVDMPGMGSDTPLVSLVRAGENIELMQQLLDHGADPDQVTREGQRLLLFSIALKRSKVTMALLQHENKPDVKTPLIFPVSQQYRKLYQSRGIFDWYCRNVKGVTPLMAGVLCQDLPVVEKLIHLGAKRNQRTSVRTYPVQMAAMSKNIPMQQLLLGVPYQDHLQQRKFIIDLSEQRVYYYEKEKLVKSARCSTGKSGYRTRTGMFVISDKERHKVSNIYIGAKMPYFQRFSCSDFGFHQGNVGSRFASHGCIRLPMSVARFFFTHSKVGDRVLIRK